MNLKLLFLLIIFSISPINGQMLISGVIDGPLSGGTPKAIELYVYENIADLSIFGVGSANNGGGSDGEEYTFPNDAVSAGSFIYVATEETEFFNFFGISPNNISGSAASINGDDAVELFKNGSVIDVFGDINVDGTGEPWDHLDGWAYRNNDSGPDGSTFVLANWSFSGTNALDGETSNSTAATPFPIGSYIRGTVTIPDPPIALEETNVTHESFTANWNSSSGATTYFLDVSENSSFSPNLVGYDDLNVGNVTNYSVTGLNPTSPYFYRVRASNSAGTSGNSNVIDVTTSSQPRTTVQFTSASGSVLETGGTYNLVVSISNPSSSVATTSDVVLTSGQSADINGFTSSSITFDAGSSENQIITLNITDDGIIEGNETLTFEIQNVSGGNLAEVGAQADFNLTIIESAGGDYYDNIDPNKSTFLTDLKNRIRNPYTWVPYSQHDETNIANFASIDNGDGTKSVFCVYSNYEHKYSGDFSWIPLSREHTFPHSWMPTNPADEPIERDEYADQHHLFPTHQDNANAVRSNHPLGEVETPDSEDGIFLEARFGLDASGNTVYEPRDEHKGDAARAILYMIVRYDDIDGYDWGLNWVNANSGRDPQELDLLLDWHNQDPPDQWELDRNDYVQSIQGNRNPFVDHPEYVNYIDFYEVEYLSNSLFFSEYVEGSSNNKALEIFNNTGSAVDLSLAEYKVEIYSNGAVSPSNTINLNGIISDAAVHVIANTNSDAAILSVADQTSGSINFNGDDAISLVRGSEIVDVIGQIGFDPGDEWGSGDVSTKDNTIRRKSSIGIGDADGSDEFDPAEEWNGFAQDTFDGLGSHIVNDGPPTITNLIRTPNIPTADENVLISADITDDIGVESAILKYTVDDGAEIELVMTRASGATYEATIPSSAYSDGSILAYKIYAEDEDGAFSISKEMKVFTGTTPIENLNVLDDIDYRLLHIDAYARIAGVATVESEIFSTSSLDIYIQDATAGINIYKGGSITTILRGYNYIVEGRLEQYNGKAELVPDNLASDIMDGGVTSVPKLGLNKANGQGVLPEPIVLTISQFLADPETYEGMLVGIQHLQKSGGDTWPADGNNANVEVTDDGGTTVLTLRIDKDTEIDGSTEPTWPKDIVGIFTQFDVAAPYSWGYQIQPRDLMDIQEDGALPVELTTFTAIVTEKGVNLNWETATEVNNYGFEIERQNQESSIKNQEWKKLGFVEGHGNSNSKKTYNFADNSVSASGKYSYRLKQIDIDGQYEYSQKIEIEVGIPTEFEVAQNYPNPFNPTTTIAYSIPERTNVSVDIFNMLGQKVLTILEKEHLPGKYRIEFDASNLSSGSYLYRISTSNNTKIRKMLLLK